MEDIPDAQIRSDEEEDQPDFDVDPNIKLCLPSDIALSLSGPMNAWNTSSGKRSREEPDASSSKVSKRQEGTDINPNQDSETNEFGLPCGDWEDFLLDLTAEDIQNALDSPLAGWASYGEFSPPNPVLSHDSAVKLLLNLAPDTIFYRGGDQDPLSIALRGANAVKVPNNE